MMPMTNDPVQAQAQGGQVPQPGMGGQGGQGPVPIGPPVEDPNAPMPQTQGDPRENMMDEILATKNLAERWKNKKKKDGTKILDEMGSKLHTSVLQDEQSRSDWMKKNQEWIEMAMLIRKNKNWPWQNASNIKYPLIATAAMQFSARAYPSLVPSDGKIVKAAVTQMNATGAHYDAAQRVAHHMSWQVRERIPDWEENMDKGLMTMAISGIVFKKTYHDPLDKIHRSDLIYPENLIINYHAKSLRSAYRKTEVLYYFNNEIQEKVNGGIFLDLDYGQAIIDQPPKEPKVNTNAPSTIDEATPHKFFAVHTYWDLDGDGYEEPYVITIHAKSRQVCRIIARWESKGVLFDEDGDIIKIEPIEYFTAFPFIPNPDGSIYGMGFGMLLGPLNESVNSIINQLVDAGTLNNLQSGFIGKGLRLKIGETALGPGEWKVVNSTGDDLRQQIFPMPTKEPSAVLFQLLGMLIQSGNQLASIAEIFVGKMPGQNTPATTTQETVQQGMAVFTAIYKRVYRSLTSEFKKLYRLNKIISGTVAEESQLVGIPLQASDYDLPDWMISPGADPQGDSQTIKMQKNMFILQNLMPLGTINPISMSQRVLRDMEIPDAQEIIMQPQPQEDPKAKQAEAQMQLMQVKAQMEQAQKQMEMQHKQKMGELEMALKEMELQFKMKEFQMKSQMKQVEASMDMQMKQVQQKFDMQSMATQQRFDEQSMARQAHVDQKMADQKLKQGDAAFKQKQQQQKATQQQQTAKAKKGAKPK